MLDVMYEANKVALRHELDRWVARLDLNSEDLRAIEGFRAKTRALSKEQLQNLQAQWDTDIRFAQDTNPTRWIVMWMIADNELESRGIGPGVGAWLDILPAG